MLLVRAEAACIWRIEQASISCARHGGERSPLVQLIADVLSTHWRAGGYHPVSVGQVYHRRYTVLRKLGWGHFSTVWQCSDTQTGSDVAMKVSVSAVLLSLIQALLVRAPAHSGRRYRAQVQKSASHYTAAAYDEIEILRQIQEGGPEGAFFA